MEENKDGTQGNKENNHTSGAKKLFASFAAAAAFALCLIISVVLWRNSGIGVRRVFIFERAELRSTGKARLAMEARFLPRESVQGGIKDYVDDLLLGPIEHGLNPLFAPGTRAESCFLRGGVLYLDLSDALLNVTRHSSSIEIGISLLKKNILRNFSDVKEVCVFVGGIEADFTSA